MFESEERKNDEEEKLKRVEKESESQEVGDNFGLFCILNLDCFVFLKRLEVLKMLIQS